MQQPALLRRPARPRQPDAPPPEPAAATTAAAEAGLPQQRRAAGAAALATNAAAAAAAATAPAAEGAQLQGLLAEALNGGAGGGRDAALGALTRQFGSAGPRGCAAKVPSRLLAGPSGARMQHCHAPIDGLTADC